MKKKAIEKIPYLGLRKVSRKKGTKYIGVTAIKIVGHEKHLFVEVYKNNKDAKEIPVVRIVIAKKDFGTYLPETGEWTRKKCDDEYSYSRRFIWENEAARVYDWEQLERENILQGEEDLERIKKYCGVKIWKESRWWEYIKEKQNNIACEERRKAQKREYERRKQALKERDENTKPLPERKILKMADRRYFHEEHYLYYKKHGSWAQIACSACGGVTDAKWKAGDSYEGQFGRQMDEPRENTVGTCPLCGTQGTYKCKGKAKKERTKKIHMFLGQKYKRTGMVLRYIEVAKSWNLGLICTEKGDEMYNASEELSGVEIARAYFEPGKKLQIDYQKHNPYTGKDFWDDCNLCGMSSISINSAPIMSETYEEMKGTIFQYSALKEYAREEEINPIDYFERYLHTPQIEMLVKLGLTKVVSQLMKYRYGIVANEYARRPDEFLGIRKERVKQLIASKGDIELLEVMQMEKRMQQIWTSEQIEQLAETGLKRGQIERATEYMSVQQLLNRIRKYAGCEFGTRCGYATVQIRGIATTYTDYLSMRIELGYDLKNTVYQQPRSLRDAHAKMVMEMDKEKVDERLREVKVKYSNIRHNYRKLRKKYLYEDESYIIRPARSAEEIVMEGRILHHCVGGDNYLKKHSDGTSYILMLRRKSEQETPYITVEIDGDRPRIMQWYGSHDRKPDRKNMQDWLDAYTEQIKGRDMSTDRRIEAAIA